ncbi:hypothetical protein KSS87_001447 [Heliosperma pusillum]|nr:hypothetical protein KSS87_001447 [Heliosperma pusillum]
MCYSYVIHMLLFFLLSRVIPLLFECYFIFKKVYHVFFWCYSYIVFLLFILFSCAIPGLFLCYFFYYFFLS